MKIKLFFLKAGIFLMFLCLYICVPTILITGVIWFSPESKTAWIIVILVCFAIFHFCRFKLFEFSDYLRRKIVKK